MASVGFSEPLNSEHKRRVETELIYELETAWLLEGRPFQVLFATLHSTTIYIAVQTAAYSHYVSDDVVFLINPRFNTFTFLTNV